VNCVNCALLLAAVSGAIAGFVIGCVQFGSLVAGLNGCVIGFLAAYAPFLLLVGLNHLLDCWHPPIPACRCGANGYRFVRNIDRDIVYLCYRCGRQFVRTDRSFIELLPDGSTRRYMTHVWRWGVVRWGEEREN
jgi:hypothetical protein